MQADLVEDVGSFAAAGSSAIGFVGLLFTGPYKIPAVGFSATAVYTNTCGRCSYRGPWMMETMAREQMMDVIARQLGIDPLEFRRRNVVNEADLPFTTAAGLVYDAVSIGASLEQAAAMIDYDAFRAEQAARPRRGPPARRRARAVRRAVRHRHGQPGQRGAPSSASASTGRCRRS